MNIDKELELAREEARTTATYSADSATWSAARIAAYYAANAATEPEISAVYSTAWLASYSAANSAYSLYSAKDKLKERLKQVEMIKEIL